MGASDDCVFFQLRIGDVRLGPGKVALLEAIRELGSISAAARKLGMSYRRAWNLVDDMNRAFAEPAVATRVGGPPDQGARVTEFGLQLIAFYRDLEEGAAALACESLRFLRSQVRS